MFRMASEHWLPLTSCFSLTRESPSHLKLWSLSSCERLRSIPDRRLFHWSGKSAGNVAACICFLSLIFRITFSASISAVHYHLNFVLPRASFLKSHEPVSEVFSPTRGLYRSEKLGPCSGSGFSLQEFCGWFHLSKSQNFLIDINSALLFLFLIH